MIQGTKMEIARIALRSTTRFVSGFATEDIVSSMTAMVLDQSLSSSSTCASADRESLLLSHVQTTDEWTGWCTVESEPVPPFPPAPGTANNTKPG
jgi:hypothetical protein